MKALCNHTTARRIKERPTSGTPYLENAVIHGFILEFTADRP